MPALLKESLTGERSGRQYTIFAPAMAKWWGSDARALSQAFRRLGHNILELDEEDYISWRPRGLGTRVIRRLFSRVWVDDYNQKVLDQATSSSYDFILVFKGNLLRPDTLRRLRQTGKPLYNFYPDVSFADHGANIPAGLSLYDCVFSTKSYHGKREEQQFSIRELQHVRHGFDPEVHRPILISPELARHYECDVSFVGCWSQEKEERLLFLANRAPDVALRVYGSGWNYASADFKRTMGAKLRPGVFGDELSIVYCASKMNLGLLSSSDSDPALRDQTTARSFQIPATRSFMLHEDTEEIRSYFEPDKEIMLFAGQEEMVEKVRLALNSPVLREEISYEGYQRCQREPYDYASAAQAIVSRFEEKSREPARSSYENEPVFQLETRITQ